MPQRTTAEAPTPPPRAKATIALDADYSKVIGNMKAKFLQECTTVVSLNGDRDVECYDVRSGSIILELRGSSAGVAAAEQAEIFGF